MILPRIVSLGTALPRHVLRLDEVRDGARRLFQGRIRDFDRLAEVYANAGVETRRSCMPLDWYMRPSPWSERMRLFAQHGLDLSETAARRCLEAAGRRPEHIDAVLFVSTTGIATPSLDAVLAGRLGLRPDVERLPIFGLGCAGGVLGLARGAALAQGGRRVLVIVVELCGLAFRAQDASKSNLIATALFGDGAAAAMLDCEGDGPAILASGEHMWPDSLDVMGWRIEDDGLGVVLSRDIPAIVRNDLPPVVNRFLARHGFALGDIDGVLCHPGGAKVLDALEDALDRPRGSLVTEREVLRRYGNMSAATVLFIMAEASARGLDGRRLVCAMGPGFSAAMLLLDLGRGGTARVAQAS